MATLKKWTTCFLFKEFLSFFMKSIPNGISPFNCHLLALEGHGSHVTLESIKLAQYCGLDMINLPTHTSHTLQPLDL